MTNCEAAQPFTYDHQLNSTGCLFSLQLPV